MTRRILLTGGGTAGHVTPNLALLPGLRAAGYAVSYAGTRRGIERELLTKENVPYYAIPAGKLRRYIDFKNLTDVVRIGLGFLASLALVARLRPHLLFSKGGFVSCPVVWASWALRVPVVIHESDISPGLANRLSLPFASKICHSFPETAAHLPKNKAVLTGVPVRESLLAGDGARGRALCGFTDEKPVVLVTGGSQGAAAVNECVRKALDNLLPEFNVCHLCGRGNLADTRAGYRQFEYVTNDLADLFACADAVISRAGATTIFELVALRKPNLLIPLPLSASRGDQILNARSFAKLGWSRVLLQEEMTPDSLAGAIREVYKNREAMAAAMKKTGAANGTAGVMAVIEEILNRKQ